MAGMSFRFQKLLETRKIVRIDKDASLVNSEFDIAENDLKSAKDSNQEKDFKWAIVQAYYSMFHVARGLVFAKGYREKSHRALLTALKELYPNEIESSLIDEFRNCMKLREEADYQGSYSELSAEECIKSAEEFLESVEELR